MRRNQRNQGNYKGKNYQANYHQRRNGYNRRDINTLNPIYMTERIKSPVSKIKWITLNELGVNDDYKTELKKIGYNKNNQLLQRYKDRINWTENMNYYNRINLSACVKYRINKIKNKSITNGYMKMSEMCRRQHEELFGRKKTIKGLFLAEYPGYFSKAVVDYLGSLSPKVRFSYLIQSLDPNIHEPALKASEELQAIFDKFSINIDGNDGDLTNTKNLRQYIDLFTDINNKVNLVISDGGVPIGEEFGNQEEIHYSLFLGEIVVAINALKRDGSFMIKMYHLSTLTSYSMLLILHSLFREVNLHKPKTSRSRNDEKYIICSGFKSSQLSTITDIILEFIDKLAKGGKNNDWIPVVIDPKLLKFYSICKTISTKFIDAQREYLKKINSTTTKYRCDNQLISKYITSNHLL